MKRLFFCAVLSCLLAIPLILFAVSPTEAQGPIIGEIRMYSGYAGDPPDGWLWCIGTPLSSTVYPELYTVISTTYGTGSGDPTKDFNVPDLLWQFPVGAYPGYTCADGFCPGQGEEGGEALHTLTESELPAHSHPFELTGGGSAGYSYVRDYSTGTFNGLPAGSYMSAGLVGETGGDEDHNNIPPYTGISFIIAYTSTNITPTPTITPTATPTSTPAVSYISAYTQTLTSGNDLVVPVYVTFGNIFVVGTGLLILASFLLSMLARVTK